MRRANGYAEKFTFGGNSWVGEPESDFTLAETAGEFTLHLADNSQERYNAAGQLLEIITVDGRSQTLSYDGDNRLGTVTADNGETLEFTYTADDLVETITHRPSNRTWTYTYSGTVFRNLDQVQNPDGTTRQYHYENATFPYLLTGITDERNVRYATFEYDDQRRATATYHADNAERVDIAYDTASTRTLTNSRGDTTEYSITTLNGVDLVTGITGPGCVTCGPGNITRTFDPATNDLLSKTENGLTTEYGDYDGKGQYGFMLEAVGTAEERRTDYTYDPRFFNKITSIAEASVNPGGSKGTTYTYDDFGNRTSETVTGFAPDGQGGFVPVTRTTTWQYNGPFHQLSMVDGPRTDIDDHTQYRYYADDPLEGNNRARLKEVEDANGVLVRSNIQYSDTGKVLSELRSNGLVLMYGYAPGNDRLIALTQLDIATGQSRTTAWTYLVTGEVETITTGYGSLATTTLTFGYDDARRLTRITDGLGNYIEYALDTEDNRIGEAAHDGGGVLKRQLDQTFDLYNRLDTSAQANETRDLNFAPDGTLDVETDGNSVVTDYSYDTLRRLTQTTRDLGGSDPSTADATTRYGYDVAARLTSVTDPIDGTTTYAYDDLGNLVSGTSPDTGATTYQYDAAGNLIQKTTAVGSADQQVFTYTYDALNRLTALDAPGTDGDIAYTYDSCANGVGRLCSATQNGVVADYAYNAIGDVIAHQGVGYAYDAAGRVQTITYPSGAELVYQYDAAGQVSRVELNADGSTAVLADAIQYEPFGPVRQLNYGNGLSLSQALDSAYRLTDIAAGPALSLAGAQYDANGNLIQRTDDATLTSWDYDALNRLELADGLFGSRDYAYDRNGNRTQLVADGQSTAYSYEPVSNRLQSETGWSYTRDAHGNTLEQLAADGTGRLYGYDSHNRLSQASERTIVGWEGKGQNRTPILGDTALASYIYNGLGQRTGKTLADGTEIHYRYSSDGQLLAELDAGGNPLKEYLYLNGQPLAVRANTVIPGGAGTETVVDNDTPGTSATGSWTVKTSNKDYGADYRLAAGGTGSSYRWTPSLSAGTYAVYVWWVSHNSHSDSVPYTLVHNGQSEQYTQNQRTNGGQWVLLGTYDFAGDGTEYLEVSDANGKASADAVKFVEQLPPTLQAETLYVHNDHLGTPRALTDEAGTTVWRAEYDPFGEATVDEDPDGDGVLVAFSGRFPGQYYDQETGLHYNYLRYYDPATGRYITSDPIGLNGGLNTYLYGDANPLRYIDPTGESALTGVLPIAGGAAAADGPLPIGDLLGITLITGAVIYDMCKDKECPPCKTVSGKIVPVGTIGYRPLDTPPDGKIEHGIAGPHYNIYKANQNPNNCQCFWQPQGAVSPSALPPGAIPIEPFAN
ncbi:MAG: RHS repeat-associated core domain-containing protein [Gammaproteobacteria bacterium]